MDFRGCNFISQGIYDFLILVVCQGVVIELGDGRISPYDLVLIFVRKLGGF